MNIKVLGSRGEVELTAPYHSKHTGVLIDGILLLDLGEKEFLNHPPRFIFITHLHPDHAFFILEPTEIAIPVYAPEEHENLHKIQVLSQQTKVDSYTITPIPTHHSLKVKSQAYLIERGPQKILYTGDLVWINKKYHHLFKDLKLVITEGSFIRKGGMVRRANPSLDGVGKSGWIYGHTGIPNLLDLFSNYTDQILFVHFGSWFYQNISKSRQKLKQLGQKYHLTVYVGYDCLELDLP